MQEPVIVRLNRRRLIMLGAFQTAAAIMVILPLAIPLVFGVFDPLMLMAVSAGGVFAAFAFRFFALARRDPVALRMDRAGISGYYCAPATWDEIAGVRAFSNRNESHFLGFSLHDPVGFRDRLTPFGRLRSWAAGRRENVQIVLSQYLLRDADVTDLAQKAQAFLAQSEAAKPHGNVS